MEAKLAEYRQRKAKEERFNIFSIFNRRKQDTKEVNQVSSEKRSETKTTNDSLSPDAVTTSSKSTNKLKDTDTRDCDSSKFHTKSPKIVWLERVLKFLVWILLWLLFIEYQFGIVYFISSLIVIIYLNTRTEPQDGRHLSAYSVFNPNFERIDGTFTAEQFEKELLYGAGSVKRD